MRDRKSTAALQQICAQVSTVQPEGLMGNGGCVWAGPTGDFSKQQVGVSIVCGGGRGRAGLGGAMCRGKARGASHPQPASNFTPRGVPNTSMNIHAPKHIHQNAHGSMAMTSGAPKCPRGYYGRMDHTLDGSENE